MSKEGFNRRDVLFGLGAVVSSAGSEAQSKEKVHAPEQLEIYDLGLAELRKSAQTAKDEIKRIFVRHSDGSAEWISLDMTQSVRKDGNAQQGGGSSDLNVWLNHIGKVKDGAFVEDFHTHPIHQFDHLPNPLDTYEDIDRVPPSPTDIIGALYRAKALGLNEIDSERLRTKVVSASGIWENRAQSYKASQALVQALEVPIALLSSLDKDAGLVFAAFIRRKSPKSSNWARAFERDEGFLREYQGNPGILSAMHLLVPTILAQPDIPPEAKAYAATVLEANQQLMKALKTIAPETDGLLFESPKFEDSFESYIARWRALGIDLTFKAF